MPYSLQYMRKQEKLTYSVWRTNCHMMVIKELYECIRNRNQMLNLTCKSFVKFKMPRKIFVKSEVHV